ncbi:arf-GAP domain and FG repeat-containing protein 1a isoform X2 [Lepisosteus oculatus]|uniref:arf-GAP domain and FG repeat-containing protein 1a isoform X2 n=1 Tax=Lepisosteus oculatus TaxID=7918 RepID=UPI00074028E4|nr:PREDICTED: arf-GAP domain and FG repeat-containing protein 1 isoform X2 [Lepisosteus oculatus]
MAASAKRKQEEKHLKMLREMTSLPPNRKCFDCDQRGPTYANMTVGSFVCTSCSGILRGLNPPHRVKSISMTTFTQQEIEFLQKHGNEVCKQIWLGLYDERSSAIPDFREPQKVKEFLQEKYEKKRWYVPPEQAKVVASVHASISGSSASSTSSTPEVRPLKSLLGESAPTLHLNKSTPSQSPVVSRAQAQPQQMPLQEKKQFDLLSDLGGDIFAAPPSQATGTANFANFAHFNSHTAQNNANADFANFDAFGNNSASGNFGGFPTASQPPFQPPNTAFRTLSSSCSFGEFTSAFPLQAAHSSSSGLANANFANFDNFPKSSSADFGAFSSSQSNSTGVPKAAVNKPSVPTADKYAALADLDNIFSSAKPEQGAAAQVSSVSSAPAAVPAPNQPLAAGGDRYAALAELDSVFCSSMPTSNVYSSTVSSSVFGSVTGPTQAQPQQVISSIPAGFGAAPSTNPFVAAAVAPAAPPTNPFQTNGRAAVAAAAGLLGALHSQAFPQVHFASFGTGSMSMPAGFGATTTYNLPTSFSGTFQQPPFPGQAAFPPQAAYQQQPNGFGAFGQAKPVVTSFGPSMAAPGVSSNPFMAGAPAGQFPAGSSSTNPFL